MSTTPTAGRGSNSIQVVGGSPSLPEVNQMILEADRIDEEMEAIFANLLGQTVANSERSSITIASTSTSAFSVESNSTQNEISSLPYEEFRQVMRERMQQHEQDGDAIEEHLERAIQGCEQLKAEVENRADQPRTHLPSKAHPQNVFWLAMITLLCFGVVSLMGRRIQAL